MAKMRNTLSKPMKKRNFKPRRPRKKQERKGEREIQDGVPEVVKLLDLLSPRPPHTAAMSHTQKVYSEPKQSQTEQKKSLHPSWEAAKLRKQKMGAVQTEVKAQKIVFD